MGNRVGKVVPSSPSPSDIARENENARKSYWKSQRESQSSPLRRGRRSKDIAESCPSSPLRPRSLVRLLSLETNTKVRENGSSGIERQQSAASALRIRSEAATETSSPVRARTRFEAAPSPLREPSGASTPADDKATRRRMSFAAARSRSIRDSMNSMLLSLSRGPEDAAPFPDEEELSPRSRPSLGGDRYVPRGVTLGQGNFGVVHACLDKVEERDVACKSLPKVHVSSGGGKADVCGMRNKTRDMRADIGREVDTMRRVGGGQRGVVGLLDVVDEGAYVHLFLDMCKGGSLSSLILKRKKGFSEDVAKEIFRQLAVAVQHVHSCGVLHRDIKPENMLLMEEWDEEDGPALRVKLADFGLAVFLKRGEKTKGMAGSPYYFAPEIVRGHFYGHEADVWSMGVVLYVLLSGSLPFHGHSERDVFHRILDGTIRFGPEWRNVTPQAKSLVRRMLMKDPKWRPTADEVLQYAWLRPN